MDVPQVGEPPRFLLLLPPLPSPVTGAALKAAYGETIGQVLKEVATHSSDHPKAAVLEIALACSHLAVKRHATRSSIYDQTQAFVAGLYKLITIIAAQEGINTEDDDGVDARVLLIAWSPEVQQSGTQQSPYGPVIDLGTLARSGRPWRFAFGVESESGEAMVRAFVTEKGQSAEVNRVHGGPVMNAPESAQTESTHSSAPENPQFQKHFDVINGGTWDHLHVGHKLLITMTIFAVDEEDAAKERSATIGITGDALLVNKKHANLVQSWVERQKAVATFFNAIIDFSTEASRGQRHASIRDDPGPNGKSIDISYPHGLVVKCTEIQDPYGPTITEEKLSALVLSAETRSGGKAVNDKRKELGWHVLDVYEVDVLEVGEGSDVKEGFEDKISSTGIREKLARKAGGKI
ncbi:hypothetical protein AC578_4613 [Pseudocercospora eumusae]|uniref:Cytidyltransferase-like domain-containing protein n=1 Tax=Pseudocercospora eumusae TaxID=321146 RepID=A0A139H4Y5_9PEZI|nr:hypothetical protein AC578_4613 [Pseudocercospora eumusae]